MPMVLVAGCVVGKPRSEPFPTTGRPRVTVGVRAENDGIATIFKIIAHDDLMAEAEVLAPGDSVAVQGQLLFVNKENRIVGLYIIACQILALRRRSPNRLPVGCALRSAAL